MSDHRVALDELARTLEPGTACTVSHYLYLPKREDAPPIVESLRARSFQVQERLGADGVNWLILASHTVVPSLEVILKTRALMNEMVRPCAGEYDGWEADLKARA